MKSFVLAFIIGTASCNDVAIQAKANEQHGAVLKAATLLNSHLHHHQPIPYERGPLECSCPETYTLINDRCERQVQFPLETQCPIGYQQTGPATCLKQRFPDERCPFGYARVKSECVRRDVTIPELTCPEGYEFESSAAWSVHKKKDELICVRRITVENEFECPDGRNFQGQCTTEQTIPAQYTCPQGYTPGDANTCHREDPVECGLSKHQHLSLRKLEAVSKVDHNVHGETFKPWHGDHHKVIPATPVVSVTQSCTANITIQATPYCETGALRGRLCVEQVPIPPVLVCPAFGTVADCYAFERVNPVSECPDGFHKECAVKSQLLLGHGKVDCECVRSLIEPVQVFCPPGAVFENGLCVSSAPPFTGCPVGTQMIGGACQDTEYKPCVCTYSVQFACQGPSCKHH